MGWGTYNDRASSFPQVRQSALGVATSSPDQARWDRTAVRAAITIVLAALGVRLVFVLWAPDGLVSDGEFYHGMALSILNGYGFSNFDGSAANLWMPGWPAFLAAIYGIFGISIGHAQIVLAVIGAGTTALVIALGARIGSRRIALSAGALHAFWPGLIFYSGVLFGETLFSFVFTSALLLIAVAAKAEKRPFAWTFAAGAALGLAVWIRSEPVVYLAVAVATFMSAGTTGRRLGARTVLITLGLALVISPWTVRNAVVFGRFIPTAVNGGIVFYEGNHPGAPGGPDLLAVTKLRSRLPHLSHAESNLRLSQLGWDEGFKYIRQHPVDFVRAAGKKLFLTYSTDDRAPVLVRGFEGPRRILPSSYVPIHGYISESTMLTMQRFANVYWWGILMLVAVGMFHVRRWPRYMAVLVAGTLALAIAIHTLMIGGSRYHFPETPLLAILAAQGGIGIWNAVRRARLA